MIELIQHIETSEVTLRAPLFSMARKDHRDLREKDEESGSGHNACQISYS
jgi:hypothetical protein